MTNYGRGVRLEYKARDRLLEIGYHTVVRAAGSHGWFDLFALGAEYNLGVQVKGGNLSEKEIADILKERPSPLAPDTHAELWLWRDGGWDRFLA